MTLVPSGLVHSQVMGLCGWDLVSGGGSVSVFGRSEVGWCRCVLGSQLVSIYIHNRVG